MMSTSTLERQLSPPSVPWDPTQDFVAVGAGVPDREGNIFASKEFWLGGCISVAIWTALALALLH